MTPIAPLPIVRSMLYRPSVFSSGASAVMFKTLLHPLVVYCQLSWGRQPPTRQNVGNATRRPKPSHVFNHPGVVASATRETESSPREWFSHRPTTGWRSEEHTSEL